MRRIFATLWLLCALGARSSGAAPLVVTSGAEGTREETIFGYALAAAGGDIVVGAPHATVRGAAQAGAVYVFDGGSGAPRLALLDPVHAKDDLFGHAVAATRDRILVGAPRTQTDGLVMAGAAYLFDARSGELLRTFAEPTPAANAEFGSAVALTGDGVLIAAPAASVGFAAAAGRIYRFDAAGKVAQTFSAAPPRPYEIFGTAFAAAGAELLVGAPQATIDERAHAGAAYLLDAASGAQRRRWGNPAPAAEDLFGSAVAATRSLVAIGAPNAPDGVVTRSGAVYVYDRVRGDLLRTLREPGSNHDDRWFGYALAPACGHLLVSALHATVDGQWLAGLVYEIDPATGAHVRTLREPVPGERGGFGIAVAALSDRPLVGAERGGDAQRGAAYLFDCGATP
ncbi:MAG TPA: hypothetical protein VGK30_17940 [Candidatus Binatia bacterium]|jgi:hypothetical protein